MKQAEFPKGSEKVDGEGGFSTCMDASCDLRVSRLWRRVRTGERGTETLVEVVRVQEHADSSLLETEAWQFQAASTIISEGFDQDQLFRSVSRPIGIIPIRTPKLQGDRGMYDAAIGAKRGQRHLRRSKLEIFVTGITFQHPPGRYF
jgi:hypothetical protein